MVDSRKGEIAFAQSYFAVQTRKQELKKAIRNGITLLWKLAEYFEVTYKYMQECIDFYTGKYGYIL